MEEALDELRWATEHGACAVFMRGLETHHPLHHPYFFPLYEEAARLNVPIGIHSGIGNAAVSEAFGNDPFRTAKLTVIGAVHAMVMRGIPDGSRASASAPSRWPPSGCPTWSGTSRCGNARPVWSRTRTCSRPTGSTWPARRRRPPYVLQHAGEDMIMIGSDYGHADNASELLALKGLRDKGEVAPHVIDKILNENPTRFYGLS